MKRRSVLILVAAVLVLGIGGGVLAWYGTLSSQRASHSDVSHVLPTQSAQKHAMQIGIRALDIRADAYLLIPSIGVKAPIELVGRDKTGHMGVPTKHRWDGVAWYQEGPVPGAKGSSVIDGHLDKVGGAPAIFWNLRKLHVGDMVSVRDKYDHILHFQVTKVADYGVDSAPLDQIFGRGDGSYLNLITCAGDWSLTQNQYLQRLVVFTRLVS